MPCGSCHVTHEGDPTLTRSLRLHSGDTRWRRGIAIARQALLVRLLMVDIIPGGVSII